jgi:hypothetical protein
MISHTKQETKENFSKMRSFYLYVFSLIAAILAAVAPAAAADNMPLDVSASARAISIPSATGAAVPDTKYAGLAETNVSVGMQTTGLPCANCVSHAGTPSIGLPWPVFNVAQGSILTISTWFEATSYTGPCTAGLIMKQGNTTITTASYANPGGCTAGSLYGVFFTVPVPTSTGFTTVIGTISGGPNKSGAVTFVNVQ